MFRSIAVVTCLVILFAACAAEGETDGTSTTTSSSTTTTTTAVSTTQPGVTTTTNVPPASTTTTLGVYVGEELVFGGDFSSGDASLSGWELTPHESSQTVEVVSEAGSQHISFFAPVAEGTTGPEARSTVPFEVEPHTDYLLSVEARTVTNGRLFLALVFLDEDGDEILLRGPGAPVVSSSEWEGIEAVIESPADAASAYLVMGLPTRPDLSDTDFLAVDVNSVSVKEVLE